MSDVDGQLQEIAEFVTERGLNFAGGEFEYLPTGEDFVLTVSKKIWAVNHDKLVEALKVNHEWLSINAGYIGSPLCEKNIALLKELGHEI